MKIITSFTKLTTGEGTRIVWTYSEIDENGKLISQNNRENFILMDDETKRHLEAVEEYISSTQM